MNAHDSPLPTYRRQRSRTGSDRAFVLLDGKRTYLGTCDSPGRARRVDPAELRVVELIARFNRHAKRYYRRPDGTMTSEVQNLKLATRPLRKLYGRTPVNQFGPVELKAVRQKMVDDGAARTYVNRHINRVRLVFRWGVEEGLVSAAVLEGLRAVAPLKRGRCDARESDAVRPVPQVTIDKVLPHLGRQVAALVRLQLLTAARPGELLKLRPIDFDTSGPVWTASLDQQKSQHHGRERTLYFGPKAIEIVRGFMADRPVDAFLFSPAEADAEHRAKLRAARKTRESCGNRPGTNRRKAPKRRPRDHYSIDAYRRAVHRGCDRAKVDRFSLHALRHSAATELRKQFGLDTVQVVLGHANAAISQVYAEVDRTKAVAAIAKVG